MGAARRAALARFRSALRQRIQPPPLLGRQPAGQPTFDLSPRLIAQVDAAAFKAPGWWDDDPALSAFLHDQLGQIRQPVILNRARQQPSAEGQTAQEREPKGKAATELADVWDWLKSSIIV